MKSFPREIRQDFIVTVCVQPIYKFSLWAVVVFNKSTMTAHYYNPLDSHVEMYRKEVDWVLMCLGDRESWTHRPPIKHSMVVSRRSPNEKQTVLPLIDSKAVLDSMCKTLGITVPRGIIHNSFLNSQHCLEPVPSPSNIHRKLSRNAGAMFVSMFRKVEIGDTVLMHIRGREGLMLDEKAWEDFYYEYMGYRIIVVVEDPSDRMDDSGLWILSPLKDTMYLVFLLQDLHRVLDGLGGSAESQHFLTIMRASRIDRRRKELEASRRRNETVAQRNERAARKNYGKIPCPHCDTWERDATFRGFEEYNKHWERQHRVKTFNPLTCSHPSCTVDNPTTESTRRRHIYKHISFLLGDEFVKAYLNSQCEIKGSSRVDEQKYKNECKLPHCMHHNRRLIRYHNGKSML